MITSIILGGLSLLAFIGGFMGNEPGKRRDQERARLNAEAEEKRHDEREADEARRARHEASKARVKFVNAETGEVIA